MDIFNIICGVCSVAGLFVSIFTASQVIKITKNFNCNNRDDHSKVINKGNRNTYHGYVVGRDSINDSRGNKQK